MSSFIFLRLNMAMQDSHDSQSASVNQRLSKIMDNYKETLPEKLDQIERLWNKLRYFNWSDDALKVLHTITHTLAGNGKTFGFPEASKYAQQIANQLQEYIASGEIPNTSQQNEISSLVEKLAKSSESQQETEERSLQIKMEASLERNAHQVFIVDDDEHLADFLSAQLEASGYQVKSFYTVGDAIQAIKTEVPSALIMDVMFPGEKNMYGILASEQIHEIAGKHIPTIFMSARSDLTARLGALRAKGSAYFNKPIDPEKLVTKLDGLMLSKANLGRIVIIDDDELVSERNSIILQKYNYDTLVINQPLHALEQIQKFMPDLILLDIHMPDINGLELAQIIKQDDAYLTTPILFLSADKTEAVKQASMTISGDEFLSKDISQNELLRKIHTRLVSSSIIKSQIKEVSKKDITTGLVTRKYFFSLLEKSISEATDSSNLFLLHINIDNFNYVSKHIGLLQLDEFNRYVIETISHFLNSSDIACHLTDQSIAILCFEDRETVDSISDDILHATSKNTFAHNDDNTDYSVSIGITPINANSTTTEQIITQVEQAVAQAQSQGGNQAHHYAIESIDDSSASIASPDLVTKIYRAVEKRRFKLVFQPVIGMGDTHDEHYEVLLRLVGENDKLYLPSQFFPVIKQNNLIHEVDRWVVENTLDVYASNPKMKVRGNFFIKLSGESLSKGAFSIWVNNCINSTGLLGQNRVTFEIPEADILTRKRDTQKFINQLPRPICQFAIDHFGSTDDSAELLNEFKVDYVKLSGALVNQILTNAKVREQVHKLVVVAQNANVSIIAGALEDPKTLTILWAWGVRHFQGYFIHSPNEDLDYDFSSQDHSLE